MASMTTRRNRIVEGSCWTCRKRRVKCDLVKPVCTRCLNCAETCGYGAAAPVKWVGGIALRGRNAAPTQQRRGSSSSGTSTEDITVPPGSIILADISPKPLEQDGLILYFANALLPRFMLGEAAFEADLAGISQDEGLRHTVLAVSQAHHSFYSKAMSVHAIKAGKQTRQVAIQRLRERLGGMNNEKVAQDVFATVVLLCILDGMIEPCKDDNASIYHLNGGHAILGRWTSIATTMLMTTGLHAHLLSVFVTMDLVKALLSGSKPYFDPELWEMFADKTAWFGRLPPGDKFLGITTTLSHMAHAGHVICTIETTPKSDQYSAPYASFLWDASNIATSLGAKQDPGLTAQQANWETFCSVWEAALLIYYYRALHQLPVDDPAVQYATRTGVSKVTDKKLDGMLAHCTILPLLIIGAHCTRPDERQSIRQALSSSASYLSFGSLKLMSSFLSDTWGLNDTTVSWWTMFEPVANKAFLF